MGTVARRVNKNIRYWWSIDWDDGTWSDVRLREHNKHEWFIMQGAADEALLKPLLSSSRSIYYVEQVGVENVAAATAGAQVESVAQEKSAAKAPAKTTPSALLVQCDKCKNGRRGLLYCLRLGHGDQLKQPPTTPSLSACAKRKQHQPKHQHHRALAHCLRSGHLSQRTSGTQATHTHTRQSQHTSKCHRAYVCVFFLCMCMYACACACVCTEYMYTYTHRTCIHTYAHTL